VEKERHVEDGMEDRGVPGQPEKKKVRKLRGRSGESGAFCNLQNA